MPVQYPGAVGFSETARCQIPTMTDNTKISALAGMYASGKVMNLKRLKCVS